MKVTEKVHGELLAARKAKRAAKAAEGTQTATETAGKAEATTEVADAQDGQEAAQEAKPKPRGRKKADAAPTPAPAPETTATPDDDGELVVFAFRLSRAERDAIHAAAGPARASRFVKGLAVAAARGDVEGIGTILAEAKARRDG